MDLRIVVLTEHIIHTERIVVLTEHIIHTERIVVLTEHIIHTERIVVLTEHIIHTELVVTKDALFCVDQGVIFQCLLLQNKFCTLSHILTLLHHQYIYKTVSSMTDYFTLAQNRACTLNSCYYGVGSYISDISETMM